MGQGAPGDRSGLCSQPEPTAIWTSEKFLKIALGTKQKGSHRGQFFFFFFFTRKGKSAYGDGYSKLALASPFAVTLDLARLPEVALGQG